MRKCIPIELINLKLLGTSSNVKYSNVLGKYKISTFNMYRVFTRVFI
jgi:hypothetical protein